MTMRPAVAAQHRAVVIPPGKIAELHYPEFPFTSTWITIQSWDGGLNISGTFFPCTNYSTSTIDCKIEHYGGTGNISVNEPANGDVTKCGKWQ